ncbi:hypothetical protein MJO29_016176 [Puccinia striiformis f. sp. tritici]|uniref:Phosphatidylethanolamine-binding protein n=1 Tax=Puccinia striiformis f. sp. tritici PST-78 TaxID=1165861 RepID=A0A0L0VYW1_9BASI|nr:hypothetical protein Pst134EA_030430 [Puccinia striiformis f. sp. tritici]KAI9600486.1 hypothetical protein H4Q26_000269 [Puccinia striiformis f. sp. tritici PST-130]KNF04402.1 hypothetical protein PSTG_02319 [Puccinia striiformis f. sp. tritici PST-78]KAH9440348.1 hypothetical protein Pst134EB_030966 [Puccinia striiformis f. sp. tritici]KAH9446516.1 hypothetical protein Pst134EA_030430 [Puccinia striiformis f. sp. tritici]KAI7934913.1 hypothetical protein MJO29_016176 [Puccinia striiformis
MINRHSRLTRSIGQVGQIQSTTSPRLTLLQAQRNLSATTSAAATPTEDVKEIKKTKDNFARGNQSKKTSPSISPSIQKAFQESIEFLKRDAERLQNKLKDAQNPSNSIESREEIERLEILSEINDVQVRKNHNSGSDQVDMSKPIYRFLEQQRWRKNGQLGRLMETVHRLRVFPDLFPSIDPAVDLKIKFEHTYSVGTYRTVNVGNFVPSSRSTKQPAIQAQVFHPEPRLYTIVMVDPDAPDPRNHSFTNFLHWVRTNVSISATTNGELDLTPTHPEAEELKYVGPHPAEGSGTHRYTVMLFEQSGPIDLSVHSHHLLERKGFSLRRFSKDLDLKPAGVMAWISQWHERDADFISSIYRDQLHIREPRYGKEPKPYSTKTKLPSHTPLPLTHRHPPVIPWRQKIASSSADPTSS